jgi:hypothetical protein
MLGDLESRTKSSATHALDRRTARVFVTALACALLAALLLSPPVPPIAPVHAGPVAGDSPTPRRVSTSPEEDTARATPPQARPHAAQTENAIPLTRAAARRRVEKISPAPWLARFGPVSLERRE